VTEQTSRTVSIQIEDCDPVAQRRRGRGHAPGGAHVGKVPRAIVDEQEEAADGRHGHNIWGSMRVGGRRGGGVGDTNKWMRINLKWNRLHKGPAT
jgi:hypothetical protein